MSEINNYDPNNYDPNPYDDVTIDEALAQIYDRVNDRTIRQIVTILKKVIDGISTGDISRYTVEKTTAESGEVTYKLMQQINNGIPTPVGDTVSLRGSQILANYDEELQILDNIINIIKVALDSKADATDIPTVPITSIQKNGTTIMPVDGTVNITVPVVATDVAALPDTTKYAAALSLTIDSATFIVTGQLKDQNGNNLGAAQTIDLPLESVVVGGSYNSQTQKVVLTLQNGNTIEFSVADLVYGLQTELSETNKLNPAYINYDSTHRAVSDTEKSEWNGKQDVIDSSHKLSADFVDDTNAANKFATEEELEQIETNKNNILLLQQKTAKVYGFHVNPNESDSSATVTYLMDAVGMTPAKMGSTTFDWGSWADAFFIPKPCMVKPDGTVDYYLNPNNYAQKLDGTASELATAPTDNLLSNISYINNAMMEWGKIYFKYEAGQADGEWSFYVSNMNVDGTFKCWCNINANNNEIDHFYTAIYNGVGCKSKMRSVSGVKLSTTNQADTTTAAEETAAAAANNLTANPEWYTEVWSDRLLINALLYLMGKSLDLQGTYGQGISSGTQTVKQNYITGSLDDKGLFYGDTSGASTAVKVFGMENLWACCWRRIAGCILDNNVLKVKMTYDTADGSSAHGYNLTGAGYLGFGNPASAEGWLSKITADSEKGYKPSATQSNSSLYYKDYFYKNASIVAYLLLGGSSGDGARCGFYCNLSVAASYADWKVSAALSLKRWG